jgi:hypothetical protein
MNDLTMILSMPSSASPRVGNLKVISGGVTEMGWGIMMHYPHVSIYIQQHSVQSLWQIVLQKMTAVLLDL